MIGVENRGGVETAGAEPEAVEPKSPAAGAAVPAAVAPNNPVNGAGEAPKSPGVEDAPKPAPKEGVAAAESAPNGAGAGEAAPGVLAAPNNPVEEAEAAEPGALRLKAGVGLEAGVCGACG